MEEDQTRQYRRRYNDQCRTCPGIYISPGKYPEECHCSGSCCDHQHLPAGHADKVARCIAIYRSFGDQEAVFEAVVAMFDEYDKTGALPFRQFPDSPTKGASECQPEPRSSGSKTTSPSSC
jgi:hypothetical protein